MVVPPELNEHGDSKPLLAALIAIACQPNFAIRHKEKMYRTREDKVSHTPNTFLVLQSMTFLLDRFHPSG
jgi:hypothetical protein